MPQKRNFLPDVLAKAEGIGPIPQAESDRLAIGDGTSLIGGAIDPGDIGPILRSLGKPVADLLDLILTTKGKGGLPPKLRLTNVGRNGDLQFHDPRAASTGPAGFEASAGQVDTLIGAGKLDVEQPAQRGVDSIRKRLAQEFDAHVGDPRNPTMGTPKENKSPMRRHLDELPDRGRTRPPTPQPRKRR